MSNKTEEVTAQDQEEKFKKDLALIEAALYVAGRPLDTKTLGYIVGSRSKKRVQQLARALIEKYRQLETPLEVLELEDERFVLQLKTEFSAKVRKLAVRPLLSDGPLRTLAYIAYRQPIIQKQVIDARGAHAYGHIRQLVEMGLIERKSDGRNKILRVTEFFSDYFGLSRDIKIMKRQLKRTFNELMKKPLSSDEEYNFNES
ncbi:MAG: SMC-Scp complex subunit ScpB [Candidatus Bathyarchaeia archaeon]|nr:SMC-Scp complex subunit ScpB [Candidatus Bathyarchaeota archaeon]